MAAVAMALASNSSFAGLTAARSMTDSPHRARVASADVSGTLAMNAATFAMDGLSILRVQRRPTRPVSVAHEPAKVESFIGGNFAPPLPGIVHCHDVVEALASGVCQQVCSPQFTPAEPRRCSLRL